VARIPYSVARPGVDYRDLPVYSMAEAVAFLDVPNATLRWWLFGGFAGPNRKWNAPLIERPEGSDDLISFYNLAELHILSVTTKTHKVKLRAVRAAVDNIKRDFPSKHPLLSKAFYTDGRDLFVKTIEQTINVTRQGQLALKPILDLYLERIVRDDNFLPTKIYPVTRGQTTSKVVSIIPTVSSGRPVIDGYGIPVSSIWSRYRGGDSRDLLANDYEVPIDKIKGAINYVEHYAAAA
jgi:uncharacterized protein (DUF433 family)